MRKPRKEEEDDESLFNLRKRLREEAEDDESLFNLRKRLREEAEDDESLFNLRKRLKEEAEDNQPLSILQESLRDEAEDNQPLSILQESLRDEAEDNMPLSVMQRNLEKARRTWLINCGAAKRSPTLIKGGFYLCPPVGAIGVPANDYPFFSPPDKYPFYLIQLVEGKCLQQDKDEAGRPQIRCHYLEPADVCCGERFTTLKEWLSTSWQIQGPGAYRCLQFMPKSLIKQELMMVKAGKKKWRIVDKSFYDSAQFAVNYPIRAAAGGRAPGGVPEAEGWGAHFGRQKKLFVK